MPKKCLFIIHVLIICQICPPSFARLKIGVGRADCTGPAAEVTFMGYAKSSQKGCGIHLRQFSRAFIFDDGTKRAAFVSVDTGMMAHSVRKAVLFRLNKMYNSTYTESNLILSGTHTHSAPGGYLMEFMYDLPCLGFVKETFDALVEGITTSIERAHRSMVDGKALLSYGEVLGANINRSPTAYLLNPEEEREQYPHNVDKDLIQLKLLKSDDTLLGAINWFSVHPTSMNFSNCLITSDNVGYASVLLEKSHNKDAPIGQGRFVGAFASTNLGDVSPNVRGPRCIDTDEICSLMSSTCRGEAKYCVAAGPGVDMFDSTRIIAEKLFEEARRLLDSPDGHPISPPINYIHRFVDMPSQNATIQHPNGTTQQVHGCLPAMGYSFAAGTTDGVGEFGFSQGARHGSSQWNTLRDFLFQPTQEDIDCQYPKPILINSGRISTPYEWQPRIVSTQLIQLGDLFLVAVPGEFTTMSGRRLRRTIRDTAINNGVSGAKVVITGLSNIYTSYIATPEEYQMQRYEGASTIFGPYTLTLYRKVYKEMVEAMLTGENVDPGPQPPDLSTQVISLVPPVMLDTSGFLKQFGDCLVQPLPVVKRGMTVFALFISGHPRNNLMHDRTFLTVEKRVEARKWKVVATDADWETKFIWRRDSTLSGGSKVTVEWTVPLNAAPGKYRLRHFGYYKSLFGGTFPYSGTSKSFEVME
ncbi:hypothetical protein Zmor_028161 [Zophobas morio]|uniref:Neutral ceramidase n=1 Tax=Zophobas morio TaxID=2755281 RepID=A0AA38M3X6_9CUCU|nr:hypothetical protein Zmor_028161 [Zophobas morio]